jgi:hypothetical protein
VPVALAKQLTQMLVKAKGKKITMTIEAYEKPASDNMKRYYRGVVLKRIHTFMREAGVNVADDDPHAYFRLKAGLFTIDPDGKPVPLSTKEISRTDMSTLIEVCLAWAAEHGCDIPLPLADVD